MKRVIYTGNFSVNWNYFKGMQGWHIKNLWGLYRYSKGHCVDFRVIDNSNRGLQWFYDQCIRTNYDGWSLGALCSIFALKDFLESDYEEFCWLDLDVCIKKTNMNIFDLLKKNVLTIEHYDVIHDSENSKKTFVQEFMGLKHTKWCGSGFMVMDKNTASKILNYLEEVQYMYFDSILFANRLVDFHKGKKEFMNDEHIFEGIINWGGIEIETIPQEYKPKIILPGQIADPTEDVWGFHFAGTTKTQIEDFPMFIGAGGVSPS